MLYRKLEKEELAPELFDGFVRRQLVQDCYRQREGRWVIEPAPFVDDWTREDYEFLTVCLKKTLEGGGIVLGAFVEEETGEALKGFVSVEGTPLGSRGQYRDMTSLHVSEDMRGKGVGRQLFSMARVWAGKQGGEKLYLSSHSAVETQAFYEAMGCVDAEEIMAEHVEREPFDRQLECPVDRPEKRKK